MEEYQEAVRNILLNGTREENRTSEDTISTFGYSYKVNLAETGYPLLTTKKMDTFRWDSMLHELEWYLSGKHHVRDLTEETGIWDAWADEEYNLPSAYGRFWRRYPVPEANAQLRGESWMDEQSEWTNIEKTVNLTYVYTNPVSENPREKALSEVSELGNITRGCNTYIDYPSTESTGTGTRVTVPVTIAHSDKDTVDNAVEDITGLSGIREYEIEDSVLTFDQVQFVVDALNGDNPYRGPESRRLVINAWHPANAQSSSLPPCHFTYVLNVQNESLNLHLTQRSADIALGVPFNIAAYSLLGQLIAQQTGFELGEFSHTLVDAHAYCGRSARSGWYSDNLDQMQQKIANVDTRDEYREIRDWILSEAPEDEGDTEVENHNYGYDHVPGLLEQLSREPLDRPVLTIDDNTTVNNVTYDDFSLEQYDSYEGIRFSVAE